MPFTVVVTRSAPARTRGFLASAMLEIAPGVYVSPNMSRAVRERVWDVMLEWASLLPEDGGVLMTYPDKASPGRQALYFVGFPKMDLVDVDGVWLARKPIPEKDTEEAEGAETGPGAGDAEGIETASSAGVRPRAVGSEAGVDETVPGGADAAETGPVGDNDS